ncbi:MAG: acyltransferase, partial [Ruminococcaceae bacterium]|nr:acyltransferase [Oscillospiraceae bacterium]
MAARNRFIDIIKCLAIIMVVATHYDFTHNEKLDYWFPFWINMAVPIFMVVTGYLVAASFENAKKSTLIEVYAPLPLAKKLLRYILPFLFFFAVEILIETLRMNQINVQQTIDYLKIGGIGVHGTYYYPVLIQLVFLTPLIYWVVRKWKYGIVACFIFNLMFEYYKTEEKMDPSDYRLCALRYVFAVAIGCFIYLYYKRDAKWNWVWVHMFEIGALYIWIVCYTDYKERIFTEWKSTSMMAILFIAPLLAFAIDRCRDWHCKPLEIIGRSSYHILLVQIVYYNYYADRIYAKLPGMRL